MTGVFMASVLFMAVRPFESHTSGVGLSSYGLSRGTFPQYGPRRVRKL